jgi:hypothetical protein
MLAFIMHIFYVHYACNFNVFTHVTLPYIINLVNKKMLN